MSINIFVSLMNNVYDIQVDKNSDTVKDLIAKVNEERSNKITVTLIIIGVPVKAEDFSKTLYNFELEEGYYITISEYYDGGFFNK